MIDLATPICRELSEAGMLPPERIDNPMQLSSINSMPSFKRILIATDLSADSATSFQVALNLCRELKADLTILHVFENSSPVEQSLQQRSRREKDQHCLEEFHNRAQNIGVPCEVLMERGPASLKILETIASKDMDLVILGTSALHGLKHFLLGSTAEEVLRKAPCPVLTVGPRVPDVALTMEGPVLFATDFSLKTMNAILFAASFSQATGSSLHCLHVLPRTSESMERSHIVPQVLSEAIHHVATETGITLVQPICATVYGSEIQNAIADFARQERARLVVIGVRRASMIGSRIPAHLAYQIITEVPCPVMTIAF